MIGRRALAELAWRLLVGEPPAGSSAVPGTAALPQGLDKAVLSRWIAHATWEWTYRPGGGGMTNALHVALRCGIVRRYIENYHRAHGQLPTGTHRVVMSHASDGSAEFLFAPRVNGNGTVNWRGVIDMEVTFPPGPLPPPDEPLNFSAVDPRHRPRACLFCNPRTSELFLESGLVRGMWAPEPVAPGHAILFTRDPIADWFLAGRREQLAITSAIDIARKAIVNRLTAAGKPLSVGYRVQFETGGPAGRGGPHLHLDVVPCRTPIPVSMQ